MTENPFSTGLEPLLLRRQLTPELHRSIRLLLPRVLLEAALQGRREVLQTGVGQCRVTRDVGADLRACSARVCSRPRCRNVCFRARGGYRASKLDRDVCPLKAKCCRKDLRARAQAIFTRTPAT